MMSPVNTKLPMNIIVAVDNKMGIGKNGKIPWRLPVDMKRFCRLTTETIDKNKKNAVLMGRKVWESIPETNRPLKNRLNVVLSTTMPEPEDGSYVVARSFEVALDLLDEMKDKIETIWNIGGRRVYEDGLRSPQLNQLAFTYVDGDFHADVYFPRMDMTKFAKIENGKDECNAVEGDIKYNFVTYQCFS
ncbi:unnamed protein product [Anisakis simplex]|uniref:dihydrofolate reductase n=1 Tax=Anisakis simplex TaxID=6269 RepID=A0A0M3JQW7_ANISI|nr:unnamed protein product [Anisakis simplex]